jgi:RNA polymerase sigma-B factor
MARTSEEDVLEAMEAAQAYRSASLDAPTGTDGNGHDLADELGNVDPDLFRAENRVLLAGLLDRLPRREQLMLQLRYFEGMTQSQIADRLDISQMHVSRLLTKSLALLREYAGDQRDSS